MSLLLDKLENLKGTPDRKMTARCPACAEGGGDTKGDHLVIFPDGRFGCAANHGDAEHRKEIFALAGDRKPRETRLNLGQVRRPKCRPILQRQIPTDSKKGVPSVPLLQPEPKTEQSGTAGTGNFHPYARGKKRESVNADIGYSKPVPSVPRSEPVPKELPSNYHDELIEPAAEPMRPHEDFYSYVERVFPQYGATTHKPTGEPEPA